MLRLITTSLGALCLLLLLNVTPGFSEEPEVKPKKAAAKKADKPAVAKPKYEMRESHDPNGIGKFYMGREIAHVMGFLGVEWLERPLREKEEALTKLVKSLKLQPGQVVADIGAGSGVLSVMMAKDVGDQGKVIAVDVQQEMLDLLDKKLKMLDIKNVEGLLGTEKTPHLEPASVDLAIMVDVYHEFAFPYEMVMEISKSLKPGGRIVFVEYRKEDPEVLIKLVHKMTQAQVKKEINQPEFGLKWKETIGTLPRQHVIIFEKQPDEAPAKP
jgi:ubiquinone/menaquinone biosynthesis C-methylase UbiE